MAPFKSNELKSDWRSDFLTEETDCDCEGCGQDPCIKCGESHHNINEEVQGGVSVETYTKDTKFTEIETVDIIKAEPLVSENKGIKYFGVGKGQKAHPSNMTVPKNQKYVGPNYGALLVNKGKETVNPKKNEVIAASYEIGKIQLPKINRKASEADIVDEGLLKGALSGAKLIAKVTPKVTKAVFKGGQALARKGAGDIAKFKKSQEIVRRVNNINDIRASKPLVAKSSNIKWNPTTPLKSKPSVSTTSTKQITGSAGTQYKNPIGANPTAKTQYKEPITPKYTRSQKSALTGKAQKVIDQIRGKTPGAKLSAKIEKAYDKNLQKTGDKIIKDIKATPIPKEKAIVKSPGGKMTPSPSGSLAKTTDKGSAIVKNSGGKLTKDVPSNNRKLSAKEKLTKAGSGTKGSGTTYASTSNPPRRLPPGGPDEDKVRAAVAGASFGLGGYAGTKVFGKKEKKESFSNWRSEINL